MRIRLIDLLHVNDNYAWLVIDDDAGVMAVVDPADPDAVTAAIEGESARLTHILTTHHHWDHAGGNAEMKRRHPGAQVVGYAPDAARIPAIDRPVEAGDMLTIGTLRTQVLAVPGHTRGSIAYRVGDPADGDALFCGDTLFIGGCGRLFEGTAAELHHALNHVLAALPDDTRVYCGHEYTVANLAFAHHIEPDNPDVTAALAAARAARAEGRPTVPGRLGAERRHNPFLRVHEPAIQRAMGQSDPVATLAALREAKNHHTA